MYWLRLLLAKELLKAKEKEALCCTERNLKGVEGKMLCLFS